MKKYFSRHRAWLWVSFVVLLAGCFATSAKWMAYVSVDPDNLNEVLMNSVGEVVHVSQQTDGLHITSYDGAGIVLEDAVTGLSVDSYLTALDVPGIGLLIAGDTLANSLLVNAEDKTVAALDAVLIPEAYAALPIAGLAMAQTQVIVHGITETEAWMLSLDFDASGSELYTFAGATAINGVFGFGNGMIELESASGREVVTFDADWNELARFTLSDSNEVLIGDSLGRPVLFNSSNRNVRVTDHDGVTQWEFENAELEFVEGHSVGPDGHVLLWGDNANINVISGLVLDSAHFLMVGAEGNMLYHYFGGADMINIRYGNVKHFEGGLVQVTYQGWTGGLVGLVIGATVGTPYAVNREVHHDFIDLAGKRTRWMNEPKFTETFAQCGTLCIEILSRSEGHCDSLDVFNVNGASLVSLSQVCGAQTEEGVALPDTVKVTLY